MLTHRTSALPAPVAMLTLVAVLCMSGCSSKTPRKHWWEFWKPKAPSAAPMYSDADIFAPPPEPAFPGGTENTLGPEGPYDIDPKGDISGIKEGRPPGPVKGMIKALPTIYFDYDDDTIKPSEKQVLDECAKWLKDNPAVSVQVEGHCDERGTPEYNLNLGQRRSDRVREYLVMLGVDPNQLVAISYGEERPIDLAKTNDAYRLNRRVQFGIYE